MSAIRPATFFCCIGAQKAGTTTLHALLGQQEVFRLPRVKETKFFVDEAEFARGLDWYWKAYFGGRPPAGQIAGEVDPDCLFFTESARRIAHTFPGARIVVLLRNPIDRAYSHYLMSVRRGVEPLPFMEALQSEAARIDSTNRRTRGRFGYAARGRYASQLAEFRRWFAADAIHIELFHDFVERPIPVLARIQDFIGAPPPLETLEVTRENARARPRSHRLGGLLEGEWPGRMLLKRVAGEATLIRSMLRRVRRLNVVPFDEPAEMPADARAFLRDAFRDEIADLSDLLGGDFRPWLEGREPAAVGVAP